MIDIRATRGESACPSDDLFLDFILEKKGGPGAKDLLDHLPHCPDCRMKFGLLRELDPALRAQLRRLRPLARASRRELRNHWPRPGEAGRRGRFRFLAAAGSAAALLLAVFVLPGIPPGGDDALERGGIAENMSLPLGLLTEPPLLFVWTPPPGGDGYRFELVDEKLRLLASLSTKVPWALIPASVRAGLAPGQTYLWTVEAVNDDGVRIGHWRRHFELK